MTQTTQKFVLMPKINKSLQRNYDGKYLEKTFIFKYYFKND